MDILPERSSAPGVFDDGYQSAIAEAAKHPIDRPPAGMGEAFLSGFSQTLREDVPGISQSAFESTLQQKQAERNQLIEKLTGEPFTLSQSYPAPTLPGRPFSPPNVDPAGYQKAITGYASQFPEVKTDEELRRDLISEYRRNREEAAKTSAASHGLSAVAEFAGSAVASQ